jgi:DnaJ-class molecular chaperone
MGKSAWMEKCFICDGKGKINTWDKKAKKITPEEQCPACEGKGYVMMQKSIKRKKV